LSAAALSHGKIINGGVLSQVQNVIEMPDNDDMALGEASRSNPKSITSSPNMHRQMHGIYAKSDCIL
jgi:hypothetical protein